MVREIICGSVLLPAMDAIANPVSLSSKPLHFHLCVLCEFAVEYLKCLHSMINSLVIIITIIMVIFKRLFLKALSALQDHEGGGGTG